MFKKIPWGDLLLLFFSLVLAFGGALGWLYPRHPNSRLIGLTTLIGFSLAAFVFAGNLWRRYKAKGYRSLGQVTIAPGVRLTMRKGRLLLLGSVTGGFGALVMAAAGSEREYLVVGAGAVFALGGFALLLLLLFGFAGSQYLLFEKEGLRIGDAKGSFLAAWDNLAGVAAGEFSRNPVVRLWFRDPAAAAATGGGIGKGWSPQKLLKGFGTTRALQGADQVIFSWQYGVEAPILAKAVATYATDPAVRAGLEERLKLEGGGAEGL